MTCLMMHIIAQAIIILARNDYDYDNEPCNSFTFVKPKEIAGENFDTFRISKRHAYY